MSKENGKPTESASEVREVPIVEEDFAKLLKKFKIKSPLSENMAENISHTGGSNVFENPELLSQRLTAWSGELAPAVRKLILEQWFAEKGISVPEEVMQRAGMSEKERLKIEEDKTQAGAGRYVYDAEQDVVRFTKAGEPGGTLAQAKQLKEMADEAKGGKGESPFLPDEQGILKLNPKARITGVELLAYDTIRKAQERGEAVDPIDAITQAAEKMKVIREAMGGGSRDSEMVEILRQELSETKKLIQDLKEQQLKTTIEGQQKQIENLSNRMSQLLNSIEELKKAPVGRTEMDILSELTSEVVGLAKTELPSFRQDFRQALGGLNLPAAKTKDGREDRKKHYRESIAADKEIEELMKRLYFSQG